MPKPWHTLAHPGAATEAEEVMDRLDIAVHALSIIRDGKSTSSDKTKKPVNLPVNSIEAQQIAEAALILMDVKAETLD